MIDSAFIGTLKVHDVSALATTKYALTGPSDLLGSPAPKESKFDRPRYHGAITRARWFEPRVAALSGAVAGATPGECHDLLDDLKEALTLGSDLTLKFRRTGRSFDERVTFRVDGEFLAPLLGLRNTVPWSVPIFCEDPRIYSDVLGSGVYDPTTAGTDFGLDLPLDFDLVFGAGMEEPHLHVINDGNVETPPSFEIDGPVVTPRIENVTTGKSIATAMTLVTDQTAFIDVANRRLTLDGAARPDLIDAQSTDWFDLIPGENMLMLHGSGFATGETSLTVTWRDARI